MERKKETEIQDCLLFSPSRAWHPRVEANSRDQDILWELNMYMEPTQMNAVLGEGR